MKAFLSLIVASMALVATDASAQYADLSGRYRCVQACRDGLVGQPAFITQYGTQMNLVNEAGEPSRGWTDWPGHIWAPNWNEGAIYSPDGMTIQFDRGTVWQRDLGQAVIVAPVGVAPVEQPAPRVKGKTQAKRGAPPPASAPVEAALGRTAFDGNWSVVINTESGACDPHIVSASRSSTAPSSTRAAARPTSRDRCRPTARSGSASPPAASRPPAKAGWRAMAEEPAAGAARASAAPAPATGRPRGAGNELRS